MAEMEWWQPQSPQHNNWNPSQRKATYAQMLQSALFFFFALSNYKCLPLKQSSSTVRNLVATTNNRSGLMHINLFSTKKHGNFLGRIAPQVATSCNCTLTIWLSWPSTNLLSYANRSFHCETLTSDIWGPSMRLSYCDNFSLFHCANNKKTWCV